MTRKLLNRLPDKILSTIEMWKGRYNDERFNKDTTRAEIRGYIKGLVDADVLTQNEFKTLFCYMTV